jgi:hypothetical protein
MRSRFVRAPSPAMAVAFVALLLGLCGGAIALPGRNSVKANDIAKNAVTGKKVKNNSLTGADVVESKLGTVPSATTAGSADTAGSANTANTASTANELAPSEGWHEVGAPGEPPFENGCSHATTGSADREYERVAFFKDKLGIVHLKGVFQCPGSDIVAFRLPPGYRPADHRFIVESAWNPTANALVPLFINGAGTAPNGTQDGAIGATTAKMGLDGVTFRAAG